VPALLVQTADFAQHISLAILQISRGGLLRFVRRRVKPEVPSLFSSE
jgi:hypothetical protein